jgi:hypothetical protein
MSPTPSEQAHALRQALAALRDGEALRPAIRLLTPVARRVLGGRGTPAEAEGLLSDFVSATVGEPGRWALDSLLALPDAQLAGAVRNRLHQLWVERMPHWNLLRTLRGHVRVALAQPPPPGSPRLPNRLQGEDGAWISGAVAAAAHALVAQRPALGKAPNQVADALFRMYGPGQETPLNEQAATLRADSLDPEEIYALYVEAPKLVRQLSQEMGPELFVVFSLRMKGLGLKAIAQRLGHPHAAWAHRKLDEAVHLFEQFLRRHGLSHRMGLAMGRKAAMAFNT